MYPNLPYICTQITIYKPKKQNKMKQIKTNKGTSYVRTEGLKMFNSFTGKDSMAYIGLNYGTEKDIIIGPFDNESLQTAITALCS